MDDAKILDAFRRAVEIKFKADLGFHTLRGISADLSDERRILREAEQQLNICRSAPDHRGTRLQREQIAKQTARAQFEVAKQAIVVQIAAALQAEAQEQVNVYAPQRDAVMKHIEKLLSERDATANAKRMPE